MTQHLRIVAPHPGILGFYDGRVAGYRFMPGANWVDDGALSLGIASYAIYDQADALVYDTHITVAHGQAVRAELARRGVTRITVVLSHWHKDHVAGTAAFAGCQVIANRRTAQHLITHKIAIEAGTAPPPIKPLILPDTVFDGQMRLQVGRIAVDLIAANIHSDDATVLWLADRGILFAGDTVEDCCTYLCEPAGIPTHLADLDRLAALMPRHVLPNHGSFARIAAGGYGPQILAATQRYLRWLQDAANDPELAAQPLQQVIAADLDAGILDWFAPYTAVHAQNLQLLHDVGTVG